MDMMKAILDIENKAQEIENSIDSLSGDIRRETDEKIKKLHKKAENEANAEIAKFRADIRADEDHEKEAAESEMKDMLDSLEQKYKENRDKWIKEITEDITKGDDK